MIIEVSDTFFFARAADEIKTFKDIGIADDVDLGIIRDEVESGRLDMPKLIATFRVADRNYCLPYWRKIFPNPITDAFKVAASVIYRRLNTGGFLRPKKDFEFPEWFFRNIRQSGEGVLDNWYWRRNYNGFPMFNYRYETYFASDRLKEEVYALLRSFLTPAQLEAVKFDIARPAKDDKFHYSNSENDLLRSAITNLTETSIGKITSGLIFEKIADYEDRAYFDGLYEEPQDHEALNLDFSVVTPLIPEEE